MTCNACGAANGDGAGWCSLCFARFDPAPLEDAPPDRPEPVEAPSLAFRRTPSTTLRRLFARGPLAFVEPGGELQATVIRQRVVGGTGEPADRYSCVDPEDRVLFHIEPYRALDQPAWTVFQADGRPLATMIVSAGVVGRAMELRDGTSAPVAALRRGAGCFEIVETGGDRLGQVWRADTVFESAVEDEWGLTIFEEPKLLPRHAIVAIPLVCWAVWGRPARPRPQPQLAGGPPALDFAFFFGDLIS